MRRTMAVLAVAAMLLLSAGAAFALFEGSYRGTFIGDNFGVFAVTIGPNGAISGQAFSNKYQVGSSLAGMLAIDGSCEFWTENREMQFRGTVDAVGRLMGKWVYTSGQGQGNFTALLQ